MLNGAAQPSWPFRARDGRSPEPNDPPRGHHHRRWAGGRRDGRPDRFQRISNGLIGSLAAEKVPATIFINERQLNVPGQRDARAAVLEQWLDAGFDLANHTYSHPSLNQVPFWQYGDDVVKGR